MKIYRHELAIILVQAVTGESRNFGLQHVIRNSVMKPRNQVLHCNFATNPPCNSSNYSSTTSTLVFIKYLSCIVRDNKCLGNKYMNHCASRNGYVWTTKQLNQFKSLLKLNEPNISAVRLAPQTRLNKKRLAHSSHAPIFTFLINNYHFLCLICKTHWRKLGTNEAPNLLERRNNRYQHKIKIEEFQT